jgi:integrase
MGRLKLTDRFIAALPAALPGRRDLLSDAMVPGLAVRVTDKGAKSFVLYTRFPGSKAPAQRALGDAGAMSLAEAREKARHWLTMIGRGVDPREAERRAREEADARRADTFGAAAEEYLARVVRRQRCGATAERVIRRELIPVWSEMPLTDITRRDVVNLVEMIADRPAPSQAHKAFGHARAFFNWAINRGTYGLEASPCDRVKPSKLIGPKEARTRVLTDDEIAALWRAAEALPYPIGPFYRMLLLTGQRLEEVAGARWPEFDLAARLWTIPSERFKSGTVHRVPLTDGVLALLRALPRFGGGDALFSTTGGAKPISGFSQAKAKMDGRVRAELGRESAPWVNHDIRRTVRTRLSELRVPEPVAERVIGHAAKGLLRVYDQHRYAAEMREALEAWERRLTAIVAPPPDNVVPLRAERPR